MKYFLLEVEIRDGENEYDEEFLIVANSLKDAQKKVKLAILENWTDGSKKEAKNWDEDRQQLDMFDRIIEYRGLTEIPTKDARVLEKWGCYVSPV